MITAYVGMPGSGKSLALATMAVRDLLQGKPVYTNFVLRFNRVLWLAWRRGYFEDIQAGRFAKRDLARRLGKWRVMRTYEDLTGVREGRLYFDEAHLWLWARAYREIPREVISWWSQSRKHGVDVIYATQRFGSVDVHVRELTAETWHCRRLGTSRVFVYQMEDMESADKRRRVWRRRVVRLDEELADCYNTREILPPPWEIEETTRVVARSQAQTRERQAAARAVS